MSLGPKPQKALSQLTKKKPQSKAKAIRKQARKVALQDPSLRKKSSQRPIGAKITQYEAKYSPAPNAGREHAAKRHVKDRRQRRAKRHVRTVTPTSIRMLASGKRGSFSNAVQIRKYVNRLNARHIVSLKKGTSRSSRQGVPRINRVPTSTAVKYEYAPERQRRFRFYYKARAPKGSKGLLRRLQRYEQKRRTAASVKGQATAKWTALEKLRFRAWLSDYAQRARILRQIYRGDQLESRLQNAKQQAIRSKKYTFYSRIMGRLRAPVTVQGAKKDGESTQLKRDRLIDIMRDSRDDGSRSASAVEDVQELFDDLRAAGVFDEERKLQGKTKTSLADLKKLGNPDDD